MRQDSYFLAFGMIFRLKTVYFGGLTDIHLHMVIMVDFFVGGYAVMKTNHMEALVMVQQ